MAALAAGCVPTDIAAAAKASPVKASHAVESPPSTAEKTRTLRTRSALIQEPWPKKAFSEGSRPASPPTKAALPLEYLSVAATQDEEPAGAAANSPETNTTSLSCHGTNLSLVTEIVKAAVTAIFYEREIFAREMFREHSRFGLAMHRLGSPSATADEALAADLAISFGHLEKLERLVALQPAAIVLSLVSPSARCAAPLERWVIDLEIVSRRTAADGSPLPRKLSDEEAERAEYKAELGILLKQIRLSSVFLPALDARVQVMIEAVKERREVPPPPEVDEEDSDEDESESESSEEVRCHVQVLPNPPWTPPWKGRQQVARRRGSAARCAGRSAACAAR